MKREFASESDRRLHDLLQIKRLERPSDEKWLRFDRSFERRRLSAVVSTGYSFFGFISAVLSSKRFACVVSVLCLSAIVSIGFVRGNKCCQPCNSFAYSCDARPAYVRDDIVCNVGSTDFKMTFNHVPHGVWYVCDSMRSDGGLAK
jgi:hypothetical protein